LEFYTGPSVLGGPDDLDAVIRGFIDGGKDSLHATDVATRSGQADVVRPDWR
jgi:hypothetical protein